MREACSTFSPRDFVKASSDGPEKAVDEVGGTLQGVGCNLSENGFELVEHLCNCSAAKGYPSSAWTPRQQDPALPDRDGSLFRHAFYRTTADSSWSRCAPDPGAVRQAFLLLT
jgi:hypothetical protein